VSSTQKTDLELKLRDDSVFRVNVLAEILKGKEKGQVLTYNTFEIQLNNGIIVSDD